MPQGVANGIIWPDAGDKGKPDGRDPRLRLLFIPAADQPLHRQPLLDDAAV